MFCFELHVILVNTSCHSYSSYIPKIPATSFSSSLFCMPKMVGREGSSRPGFLRRRSGDAPLQLRQIHTSIKGHIASSTILLPSHGSPLRTIFWHTAEDWFCTPKDYPVVSRHVVASLSAQA